MRHHIVFLDRSTLEAKIRRPKFDHTWQEYPVSAPEEVPQRLSDATVAIVNKVRLPAATLQRLPKLKLIAIAATGYDIVDLAYCKANGITVTNIHNYAVHSVPEHVFMLVLALRRNLLAYRRDVEDGRWQRVDQFCFFDHPIRDLHGATIGIVGAGANGQATAAVARGFGMHVLFSDLMQPKTPGVVLTPFDQLIAKSDVISLHVPLTESTRNMIGREQLRKMKRTAILINTARGGIVDERALVEALHEGVIAGAGFDVLNGEPPKQGNVLLDLRLPNFILTPHIAWASEGAMQILADQLIDNIEGFVSGMPQHLVT